MTNESGLEKIADNVMGAVLILAAYYVLSREGTMPDRNNVFCAVTMTYLGLLHSFLKTGKYL